MMNIPRVTSFLGSDMMSTVETEQEETASVFTSTGPYSTLLIAGLIDRSLPVMVSHQPQVWLVDHPTSLDQVASRPLSIDGKSTLRKGYLTALSERPDGARRILGRARPAFLPPSGRLS